MTGVAAAATINAASAGVLSTTPRAAAELDAHN
jgi:hypothetical protein